MSLRDEYLRRAKAILQSLTEEQIQTPEHCVDQRVTERQLKLFRVQVMLLGADYPAPVLTSNVAVALLKVLSLHVDGFFQNQAKASTPQLIAAKQDVIPAKPSAIETKPKEVKTEASSTTFGFKPGFLNKKNPAKQQEITTNQVDRFVIFE